MRIMSKVVLAALFTFAFVSTASAQRPGGGGFGGFGMMGGMGGGVYGRLTTSKILAEELKLTEEQVTKLKEAMKPIDEKRTALFPRPQQGAQRERPTEEQMKERMEKMAALTAETKKAVEGVLSADQAKRVSEINTQVMGIAAFSNKDVEASLKLTEGQVEKIKSINEGYTKDVREMMTANRPQGGGGGGFDPARMAEMNKKRESLTKDAMEKITEILKDDQKKTWSTLTGKKFDQAKFQAEAMAAFGQRRRDN